MRVLMTTRPFHGHLNPMLPLAHALVRRGHEVRVAAAETLRETVETLGFEFVAAGLDPRMPLPTHPDGPSRSGRDWGPVPIRALADDLLRATAHARPDVVIREQTALGAALAAELLDVPCVVLGPAMYIPSRSWVRLVGDSMDRERRRRGLPLDPCFERLTPWLYLDPAPERYQVPAAAGVPVRHEIRPEPLGAGGCAPSWVAELPRGSTVYATLGTVFNRRPRVLRTLVEGLLAAGLTVVATTGTDGDAAELPADPRLRVAPWLDIGVILPHCAAVISHGGFGTVMGALWHGLPQVIVPLGSDNGTHARRCTDLGVGVTAAAATLTVPVVRDSVTHVLTDPDLRRAARSLGRRVRAMPSAETAADLVERLVTDGAPVRSRSRRVAGRPRLAVVVPAYGLPELTRALLDDVAREPWVDPVVVDNRGDHVAVHGERVLRSGRNLGWAGGCNHALERLLERRYDAVVLLNNDTRLSLRFFAGLARAHEETGAALVGPVYDGVWPHQQPRRVTEPARYRPRGSSRTVPFLDGTCLFLPAATVRDVGLLDTATFPSHGWGVDLDYAVRVRRSGGTVVVTERSYLHHDGAATASADGEGWRGPAWRELVAGMRGKYGIAWPRLVRDASDIDGAPAPGAGRASDAAPADGARARPVVVTGPPGSGTSVVHRAVNMLGVRPAGAAALDAVRSVVPTLARALDIDGWYTPADTEALLGGPAVVAAMEGVRELVSDVAHHRPALWRDTSGAVFLPFWVAACDLDTVAVVVVDDPARAAAAVVARTGCDPASALALWERRLRLCLRNLVGTPVLVVRRSELADDPTGWGTRVQEFLTTHGVPLLGGQTAADIQGLAEAERARRRHAGTVGGVSLAQRSLHAAVAELAGPHDTFPDVGLPAETPTTEGLLAATRAAPANGGPPHRAGLRAEWVRWLEDNRGAGVPDADLVAVLVDRGVPFARARRELAVVGRRRVEPKHRRANRMAWDALAGLGTFGPPVTGADLADARARLAGPVTLPWAEIRSVLCLAGGGGQQSAMFASLGCEVTVADLSPAQLALDDMTATALGTPVEYFEADMLDLSALAGRSFDLVHQPVSMCYVPDPARVHRQVAAVLRPGGWYWVEHWNPVRMQLAELGRGGPPYRVVRPQRSDRPVRFGYQGEELTDEAPAEIAWHYVHPLSALLGSLCDSGMSIVDLAERRHGDLAAQPGTEAHLDGWVPPLFTVLARRDGTVPP
jgi:UDP:flavonoid glycosyltransferase YjiC (YdhE family)/SAM-dependent methyltransferase